MYSRDHTDFGTPQVDGPPSVTLEIDGVAVTVPEGTSIMRAAATVGRQIPKLCATDSLKAFGSCRLCLVEIEGRRGFPASCTTFVSDGIKVRTESARLTTLRRGVMELYLSDHPLDCVSCPANGHCELQDMAEELDVTETRYGLKGANHQGLPKDTSNPYFTFDQTMCIACSRCVRACDETQGTFALTIQGRGFASKVSASQNEPFMASECVSCGACVEACPTVALTENSLITLGAPDRVVTTTCAYCGVGCSFKAEVKGDQVVRMVPDRNGHANHGHSCVKGRFAYGYATHPDRITTPMIRASIEEPWRQVGWEEAINHAASEFRRIQAKYGRDAIGGITSSRCTNEETFLVQKLVRAAFGNNNVDTCARVCHSPTGYGLKSTLGESAGTQAFDSVMKADVIVVVGANPTEGHPVFASQLKRRLRQGAQLIVIDPRQTALVRSPHIEAACHLQVRPGANVALFNAIAHVIVTEGLTREDYVSSRCEPDSFARWKAFVAEPRNSPEATAVVHRRRAGARAESGASLRVGRQRCHLLRARRHGAQPGIDHGHGDRESGDGDRQSRPGGRRRQPAARTEQRAGLVRHGIVSTRVQRIPARLGRGRSRHVSKTRGACRCCPSPAFGFRTCSRPHSTAASRACTSRERTRRNPIPTRSTSPRRSPRWNAS